MPARLLDQRERIPLGKLKLRCFINEEMDRKNRMIISPEHRLTGTLREVEGEICRQTYGDENLLQKMQ